MPSENGFHTTDAPGGSFFYCRMACAAASDASPSAAAGLAVVGASGPPAGAGVTTRMVPLAGPAGAAVWEQVFWFALPRPAEGGAKVEFELMASGDKK